MPFTFFHLGPALFIGALLITFVDLPTLLLASVMLDLEPLATLLFGLPKAQYYHSVFHSLAGGAAAALILAAVLLLACKYAKGRNFLGHCWSPAPAKILLSSLLGVYVHLLPDYIVNTDMEPFWPSQQNPLLGLLPPLEVYVICAALFALGALILLARSRHTNEPRK